MRRPSIRVVTRCVAVAAVGGSASMLVLPSGTAAAAAVKVGVVQQAWFWQDAYEQANPPVAQSLPASEPSGVPDGDLAVAYTGNANKSSSKMTALSFDVSNVTAGSSIESFTFALTLDAAPTATTYDATSAAIVACLPTRSWPAQLGGDFTNQPTVDCSRKVTPTVTGSTYTFKIPSIAQTWVDDQNLGVAILVDADTVVAPFQLVFAGAKDVKADLSYAPAAATSSGSLSGAGAVGVAAGGGGGPVGPAPAALPPATGDTTAAAPAAAAPVVAPTPGAQPNTRPVAAARTAPAVPTKAFWAAGLVLALIILAASLVLGDPAPVAASAAAPSRLDRVLRARTLTES